VARHLRDEVLERQIQVPAEGALLEGTLAVPPGAPVVVLFAHGSGSSRHSPRNRFVAESLQRAGLATLLFDLLTPEEEEIDRATRELRFDIQLLAARLLGATDFVARAAEVSGRIGYFGSSTGAAAALIAAAERTDQVAEVVSRGGRPDLAGEALPRVRAATLLIVGGADREVLDLNRMALDALGSREKRLEVVPNATHLFEEPGALEEVALLAANWFLRDRRSW
jgi:putative phosphoribosyl transferase